MNFTDQEVFAKIGFLIMVNDKQAQTIDALNRYLTSKTEEEKDVDAADDSAPENRTE